MGVDQWWHKARRCTAHERLHCEPFGEAIGVGNSVLVSIVRRGRMMGERYRLIAAAEACGGATPWEPKSEMAVLLQAILINNVDAAGGSDVSMPDVLGNVADKLGSKLNNVMMVIGPGDIQVAEVDRARLRWAGKAVNRVVRWPRKVHHGERSSTREGEREAMTEVYTVNYVGISTSRENAESREYRIHMGMGYSHFGNGGPNAFPLFCGAQTKVTSQRQRQCNCAARSHAPDRDLPLALCVIFLLSFILRQRGNYATVSMPHLRDCRVVVVLAKPLWTCIHWEAHQPPRSFSASVVSRRPLLTQRDGDHGSITITEINWWSTRYLPPATEEAGPTVTGAGADDGCLGPGHHTGVSGD
ncbi:hypothetical protein EDB89DRAFT_1904472 [Lactarius sanguifluus]|nr:hypothetical protein EDB89DRAFT_1904472 [Lactarius sanguifluus]